MSPSREVETAGEQLVGKPYSSLQAMKYFIAANDIKEVYCLLTYIAQINKAGPAVLYVCMLCMSLPTHLLTTWN